jgi:beta-glucosidase/6-phospho-beta-glucosidase/beta-galactosidase
MIRCFLCTVAGFALEAHRTSTSRESSSRTTLGLRAEYPKDVIEYYQSITDFAFIKDKDLKAISEKNDFLGVNYYEHHVTRAIAGETDGTPRSPILVSDALQPAWGSTHTALRQIRIRKRHF